MSVGTDEPLTAVSAALAGLASACDALAAEDVAGLDDAALLADLVELRGLADRIEAQWLRRLSAADVRGSAQATGEASSTTAFLHEFCHLSPLLAGQRRMVARRLDDLPATREAFAAGRIGYEHARVISQALTARRRATAERAGMDVPAIERALADLAGVTDPVLVRDRAQALAGALDHASAEAQDADTRARREFFAGRTLDGMVAVKGLLDPETGELLLAALAALLAPPDKDDDGEDPRTLPQRRHDALADLLHAGADAATLPDRGGERPHVAVLVPLDVLEARANAQARTLLGPAGWGNSATFTHTGPISPETARRLACDAAIHRVLVDGESIPLELGRRTRTVPAPLRRALVARDHAHCAFPGCTRAAPYCDAHHIVHWADQGPTDLDNLVLLCRFHHRKIHHSSWTIRAVPHGLPVFIKPDGTHVHPPPLRL